MFHKSKAKRVRVVPLNVIESKDKKLDNGLIDRRNRRSRSVDSLDGLHGLMYHLNSIGLVT